MDQMASVRKLTVAVVSVDKLAVGTGFVLLYILGGAIYRLYLSPIAGFPGPKLAALTYWYEGYYDIIKTGSYVFEIERMHHKYGETPITESQKIKVLTIASCIGPIIRINPHELVINDPEYYNEVYVAASTRKTEAYRHFFGGMNADGMSKITHSIDLYKLKFSGIAPSHRFA